MECYLDNAATTRPLPEVCGLTAEVMGAAYGNPSSLHKMGVESEGVIRQATERIARTLKCPEKNIVFTSGGTESNNMALIGTALANRRRGKHIVTTCFEHPSVHEPLYYLQDMGYEITALPVDSEGHIRPETVAEALREDTVLVSVMLVNNEVGAVLDVEGIARTVRTYNPAIVFHVDAVQAYGKMQLRPERMGLDLMSVSGHKIHGPKGIGFLYMADRVRTHAYLHGGGQQGGRRSGTENVPGIAGLGLAAEKAHEDLEGKREYLYGLKRHFLSRLTEIEGTEINACHPDRVEDTAPHIVSASFAGVRSEVLLHALEEKGIYVSSGSACASSHPGISGTLRAIGVREDRLESTLRFSFSVFTTREELDYTADCLRELAPVLARYTRR